MSDELETIKGELEITKANLEIVEEDISRICYRGNSVGWWWSKAVSYSAALGDAWEALREAGIQSDGETDVAAGIRKLAARVSNEKRYGASAVWAIYCNGARWASSYADFADALAAVQRSLSDRREVPGRRTEWTIKIVLENA